MNLGLLAFTVASLAASPAPARLDAEAIARRHLDAVGGPERLRAIRSIRHAGTMKLSAGVMNLDGPFLLEMKRPRKARMEATLGGTHSGQWFNGTAGWTLPPGASAPVPMTPEQVKEQAVLADFDDWLLDFKARGITVEFLGEERVGNTRALKLKLTNKGRVVHSYLDAQSFLEVRRDHFNHKGEPVDRTVLSDYADVGGGLKMPMTVQITSLKQPLVSRMQFGKPELNVDIPDSRFAPPR